MRAKGAIVGGRYCLTRIIGEGGTATIWEAEDQTLRRAVALKFLDTAAPPGSDASERFLREARLLAAIKHRNVLDILDVGLTDDDHQPYIVMERLVGRTLAEYMLDVGPVSIEEAARLASLLLRGLSAVHDARIVHRDLKPENVFIIEGEDGTFPKLVDFGLSRLAGRAELTREGMVLGTPDYMSPEQAAGSPNLDARSDVFSMGVMLYELLTQRLPFEAPTPIEIVRKVVAGKGTPIREHRRDLPDVLVEVVERAMANKKDARYADAREMRTALSAAVPDLDTGPDTGRIGRVSLSELPPAMSAPVVVRAPRVTPRAEKKRDASERAVKNAREKQPSKEPPEKRPSSGSALRTLVLFAALVLVSIYLWGEIDRPSQQAWIRGVFESVEALWSSSTATP